MDISGIAKLRVGAWVVDTASGEMVRDGESVRLDPRTLRLLLCLAGRAGELVSADELLSQVWPGVIVTPDSVYQAIASLRRVLGEASYIVTVPRQGYKLVAEVGPWRAPDELPAPAETAAPPSHATRSRLVFLATACIPIVIGIVFWLHNTLATEQHAPALALASQKSIAVLPFADLTDGMSNETFADGMTEELIGRFSKLPGYKVPAPSAASHLARSSADIWMPLAPVLR